MHVVVVGAGVFGAWTAQHLVLAGARVTLVDAYGPANSKASSGDESRIIRCGYGPDVIYSRWARASLAQWRDVCARIAGRQPPLFHECGVLWLASGEDPYTLASFETLQRENHPVTLLDHETLRRSFPHIATSDVDIGLFETDCGVLMARRVVQTLAADLERRGVRFVRGEVCGLRPSSGRLERVGFGGSQELAGDAFVFACGPWLPKVFRELLADRIRPTRQVVIYFGSPSFEYFGPERTPAWVDFPAGIYGVPDLEHRGLKVGIDRHGEPFDPDGGDRVLDAESVDIARAWLERRMPLMRNAPVAESRVCQYENTDTGDFLIDRHPDFDNVWIAGGGSGHGFKHGPAVGEYVAGLIGGTIQPEPRFGLAARGVAPRRSVF